MRDGDIWGTIQAAGLPMLDNIIQSVSEAVDLLPPRFGRSSRVEETRDYFAFIREDARELDARWRAWRSSASVVWVRHLRLRVRTTALRYRGSALT